MANDNPDWAKLEVGRIDTLRGQSLSVAQNSTVNFDSSFTAPLLYTLSAMFTVFNSTLCGNSVGVQGSPSGTYAKLLDYIIPAATNLLYTYPVEITWGQAINLLALLPGDTSYQLQCRSGPSTATQGVSLTIYAGALL
jgi:hypothetical protein